MKVWRPQTSHALTQGGAWDGLTAEVAAHRTVEAVQAWWSDFLLNRHRDYPEPWSLALQEVCETRCDELLAGEHHAELDNAFKATIR